MSMSDLPRKTLSWRSILLGDGAEACAILGSGTEANSRGETLSPAPRPVLETPAIRTMALVPAPSRSRTQSGSARHSSDERYSLQPPPQGEASQRVKR